MARADRRLVLAGEGLRLAIVAEDAHRADEVAAELAVVAAVRLEGVPAQASQGRPDEGPDILAEALARLAVEEPVHPAETADERPPDGRRRLLGEACGEIEIGRDASP